MINRDVASAPEAEALELGGARVRLVDLSDHLSNATHDFEPQPHLVDYIDHRSLPAFVERTQGIPRDLWPDGLGSATETATLSTHAGTHVDAPWHYGPESGGQRARTIDEVPLRWCIGPGVVLDFSDLEAGDSITDEDVSAAVIAAGHELQPLDIVLIRTDTSTRFGEPGYDQRHPGLRRSAVKFLVERGVKLIGIDAWGLDRPFDVMISEAQAGDRDQFFEAHLFGREREYCQIERLTNLASLPSTGFTVVAFPVALHRASGSWSRVVALVEDDRG